MCFHGFVGTRRVSIPLLETWGGQMEKLLLKASEVAEALGISRSKAYRLISQGELPHVKVGGQVRVPAEDLRRWLDDMRNA